MFDAKYDPDSRQYFAALRTYGGNLQRLALCGHRLAEVLTFLVVLGGNVNPASWEIRAHWNLAKKGAEVWV